MLRVHFYSDCSFFAGCENMLANFFNSKDFRASHEAAFTYRYTSTYQDGFKKRVDSSGLSVFPIRLPDLDAIQDWFGWLNAKWRRRAITVMRSLLTVPLLAYEFPRLVLHFRSKGAAVLHINNGTYPGAMSARVAAVAGKVAGIPAVLMVVNNMAGEYHGIGGMFNRALDRAVIPSIDLFVTGSEAAARHLRQMTDLPPEKVISLPNGIAVREVDESPAQVRSRVGIADFSGVLFGVVALLIPRKGHQVLLEATKLLVEDLEWQRRHDFMILIEGSGPLRHQLEDLVARHGLARWVKFVGDERNVFNFINAADVLVLPSLRDEDFPNVILEAMALSKPVISTRVAGIPEQVVPSSTGLLVEPGNSTELANAIRRLVDDPPLRKEMGQAAAARFKENFTSSIAISRYTCQYQRLLDGTRGST